MIKIPDWVAHICTAYIIIWLISKTKFDNKLKRYYSIFILGNLIPDLERPFSYLIKFLFSNQQELLEFWYSIISSMFHTIIGVIILSLFLSSFFPKEDWKKISIVFFLGGIGHLLLDMVMYPWQGLGLSLLDPIPLEQPNFSWHLVWPGSFLPMIISSIIASILILIDLIFFRRFFIYDLKKNV
ncbi:MAG: metal-dependent hydrolase [Candidatus Helarchaeota archaeon]